MEKIKNLSIKKTMVLYMAVSLLLSFLFASFLIDFASNAQRHIWRKYITPGEMIEYTVPRVYDSRMSITDSFFSEACDFLQTYSYLVISVAGSILAMILLYRNKIKPPLEELTAASEKIAGNELDFKISWSNQDELGKLCAQFENMRNELENNERKMWRMIEDEKALRSAIAHDIRTPLSVVKGYQEMLLEFIPEDRLDKEGILVMLEEGLHQIERINSFTESMRTLSSLERREPSWRETDLASLTSHIYNTAHYMATDTGLDIIVNSGSFDGNFLLDTDIVSEVTDNLLSNAIRFAKRKIEIGIKISNGELEVSVSDDGIGFLDKTERLTEAYYHSNPQDDLTHFGLGLYISRIYCEKHGGRILTANHRSGGAVVKAIFKLKLQDTGINTRRHSF